MNKSCLSIRLHKHLNCRRWGNHWAEREQKHL